MKSLSLLRKFIREALDPHAEEEVQRLTRLPDYQSIESFVYQKADESKDELELLGKEEKDLTRKEREEIFGFTTQEMHAIARNIMKQTAKDPKYSNKIIASTDVIVKDVRKKLEDCGLVLVPLEKKTEFRGFTSPKNGSNRFAGNHGGAGIGDGGQNIGGGRGSFGGGKDWDPTAKTSLSMGSGRRK